MCSCCVYCGDTISFRIRREKGIGNIIGNMFENKREEKNQALNATKFEPCDCSWTFFEACPSSATGGGWTGYADDDGSRCFRECCPDPELVEDFALEATIDAAHADVLLAFSPDAAALRSLSLLHAAERPECAMLALGLQLRRITLGASPSSLVLLRAGAPVGDGDGALEAAISGTVRDVFSFALILIIFCSEAWS